MMKLLVELIMKQSILLAIVFITKLLITIRVGVRD
jgi:hypothetical protein